MACVATLVADHPARVARAVAPGAAFRKVIRVVVQNRVCTGFVVQIALELLPEHCAVEAAVAAGVVVLPPHRHQGHFGHDANQKDGLSEVHIDKAGGEGRVGGRGCQSEFDETRVWSCSHRTATRATLVTMPTKRMVCGKANREGEGQADRRGGQAEPLVLLGPQP